MQYFKHSSSMRNDVRLKRVIAKYGLEGYGLYNLVVESITENIETDTPLPFLEETCEDIAEFYNGNSARIEEIMRYMIEQGLFSVETVEKRIACFKIYSYLEKSQTRSEAIRQLIESYKVRTDQLGFETCPGLSETNLIEEKRKDKEENKKRKEYTKGFLAFWDAYPRKANKGQSSKTYNSIIKNGLATDEEILSLLTIYKSYLVRDKTEEKYIKYPGTFLNNLDDFRGRDASSNVGGEYYLPPERRIDDSLIR